jgi:hypothetical protein
MLRERDWQTRVVDYARLRGWRSYHTHDSRRSVPGFPDLVLVRRGRCLFAELKSDTGRVSQAQHEWLADLADVPGLEVHLWRPGDWLIVMEVLS